MPVTPVAPSGTQAAKVWESTFFEVHNMAPNYALRRTHPAIKQRSPGMLRTGCTAQRSYSVPLVDRTIPEPAPPHCTYCGFVLPVTGQASLL